MERERERGLTRTVGARPVEPRRERAQNTQLKESSARPCRATAGALRLRVQQPVRRVRNTGGKARGGAEGGEGGDAGEEL